MDIKFFNVSKLFSILILASFLFSTISVPYAHSVSCENSRNMHDDQKQVVSAESLTPLSKIRMNSTRHSIFKVCPVSGKGNWFYDIFLVFLRPGQFIKSHETSKQTRAEIFTGSIWILSVVILVFSSMGWMILLMGSISSLVVILPSMLLGLVSLFVFLLPILAFYKVVKNRKHPILKMAEDAGTSAAQQLFTLQKVLPDSVLVLPQANARFILLSPDRLIFEFNSSNPEDLAAVRQTFIQSFVKQTFLQKTNLQQIRNVFTQSKITEDSSALEQVLQAILIVKMSR